MDYAVTWFAFGQTLSSNSVSGYTEKQAEGSKRIAIIVSLIILMLI